MAKEPILTSSDHRAARLLTEPGYVAWFDDLRLAYELSDFMVSKGYKLGDKLEFEWGSIGPPVLKPKSV